MKTTKKIIKGIKILGNSPLYFAVLVAAGSNCIGSKRKISIIELTPREEELILTGITSDKDIPDEDDDLLEQPHVEQTCVVPTQPSNISQVALAGGNTTNQNLVSKENGGARSSGRLDQSNQSINSQIQMEPDAFNEHAHDGNEVTQSDLQAHNSRLDSVHKNDDQEPSDSKNKIKNDTLSDQKISKKETSLQNFKQKMNALQKEATSLEDKYKQVFGDRKSKTLENMQGFFKRHDISNTCWLNDIKIKYSESEEETENYMGLVLKNAKSNVEELRKKIEKNKRLN